MAGFNIQNFVSNINANGAMRNNKFLVRIPPPNGFGGQQILNETGKYLELWCESANLPSAMLGSTSVRRYGYGHEEKRPTIIQMNDINFRHLIDLTNYNNKYTQYLYVSENLTGNVTASQLKSEFLSKIIPPLLITIFPFYSVLMLLIVTP